MNNLAGQHFNKLLAIKPLFIKNNTWTWLFLCDCGKEKITRNSHVTSGAIKDCGCGKSRLLPGNKKICVKCNAKKPLDLFIKDKSSRDGTRNICYPCRSEQRKNFNQARIKLAAKNYYLNNHDHLLSYAKNYRKQNPYVKRAQEAKRRSQKNKSRENYCSTDILWLLKKQQGKYVVCRCDIENSYHIDHIMPLSLGGSNSRNNIQLLCPPCNRHKHKKHPVDFMRERGFLI